MGFIASNALVSFALFLAILLFVGIGRRTGGRRNAADPTAPRGGLGVIEGVVYALLGLVLAFSFNGAGERFLARRAQIGNETNVIGTAYLRIDILPVETQPEIRALFRSYLAHRREAVRAIPDVPRVRMHLVEAAAVQTQIWERAIAATRGGTTTPASQLFLPALNEMIDEQTVAQVAMMQHPPMAIEGVLVALMLLAALFTGEAIAEIKRPSKLHVYGMAFLLAVMFFLIRDLERPLVGLIRLDDTKWIVEDLAKMMAPR